MHRCVLDRFLFDAETLIREAVRLHPRGVLHHFILGNILQLQGLRHEAKKCYEYALELQPDFVYAHAEKVVLVLCPTNLVCRCQALPNEATGAEGKNAPATNDSVAACGVGCVGQLGVPGGGCSCARSDLASHA